MTEITNIWLSGGWVMIPLFALGVLLYAEAFSIFMLVRRADPGSEHQMHWWEWVRDPEQSSGRVGALIRHVQSNVSSAKQVRDRFDEIRLVLVALIDRRTRFLGMLVSAAPLLGLLGTVLGMLQTFLGIATSGGAETSAVVASGISEALVTTQTGLTIALPGLFFVMLIQRRKHGLEARLARLESLTLSHLRFE
jgi:biopolymer transport protein ExbB